MASRTEKGKNKKQKSRWIQVGQNFTMALSPRTSRILQLRETVAHEKAKSVRVTSDRPSNLSSSPYAGRDSAVSVDAPNLMRGKYIPTVRHPSLGEKYAFGKKLLTWETIWNLPRTYLHSPSAAFEPIKREDILVRPRWKQKAEFAVLGDYGEGTPQFQEALSDILRNEPEMIFPDPNNPLLKQLLASKAKREAQGISTAPQKLSEPSPGKLTKHSHLSVVIKKSKPLVTPDLANSFVAPQNSLMKSEMGTRSGPIRAPTCNPLSNEPSAWAQSAWHETPLGIIAADERKLRKAFQLEKTPKPRPHGVSKPVVSKATSLRRGKAMKMKIARDIQLVTELM